MLVCEPKTARSGFPVLVSLGSAAVSVPVLAEDLAPGLWEMALETQIAASPGFARGPFKLNQCVTAADARDPSGLLGALSNPGATGCTYPTNPARATASAFRCDVPALLRLSRGGVAFNANWIEGTISTTAIVNGVKTETSNRVSARRVGGC